MLAGLKAAASGDTEARQASQKAFMAATRNDAARLRTAAQARMAALSRIVRRP